jgi:hypothetical protein
MIDQSNIPAMNRITIDQLVADWAQYANRDLGKSLDKRQIGKSLALIKSRKVRVENGSDGPEKIIFEFLNYGRFVDMGVGKGQKLGDVTGNKTIMQAAGLHGRVAKKWYSKVIFGEVNTLSELLLDYFGFRCLSMINESMDKTITMEM